ncbi:MAG: hypothetical protein Q7S92_03740 [Candidatus Diapherotrites archaeon]|nr:hypothetical protein [Candidatus Diapherotrites archaeon]
MTEKETKSKEGILDKKMNLSFSMSHIIIAVLLLAVISLAYVLITNPNAFKQSLERTALENETVNPVTTEQEASQAITGIGQDIKGLSSTLDEIDQSLG